mmetsp:Transcript_5121/g.7894  ORF Transcript_5121/g.7894 Transcript_5121/m.7894 type:complete len:101 (-) Transcript_5121:542-844(-)
MNDPYQAEATGVVAGTTLVSVLASCFALTEGYITQYCDGKNALEKVMDEWGINLKDAHHDILQLNKDVSSRLPTNIKIISKHIYGHEDEHYDFNDLPRPN